MNVLDDEGARTAFERLCGRHALDARARDGLRALLELLAADEHAPTTVRDPRRAIDDHLADSLVALELEPVRAARTIADVGSGAGFPGLPLALALPRAAVALLESARRKCEYLRRAIAAAGAPNVRIVHARVEEWAADQGRGWADLVTARALAAPAVVVEYAAPLLRPGGTLVMWRGRSDPEGEAEGLEAAALVGLEPAAVIPVSPYEQARHRTLHLFSKVRETPSGYPRRPGVAARRPLGRGGTREHRPTV